MPCLRRVEGGIGTFKKTPNDYKKTGNYFRFKVPFPLQFRLLVLGSCRKRSLRQKFMHCGFMQEGKVKKQGEQGREEEPSG